MKQPLTRMALPLALTALLAGCQQGGTPAGAAADTTAAAADGLSREQIERRAEPMSPAQAESLGIVDTTIHVEELTSGDTLNLSVEPVAPAPPAAADTPR